MKFRFIYRGLLKRDIIANSFSEAKKRLLDCDTVFGIHPLDFDDYEVINE